VCGVFGRASHSRQLTCEDVETARKATALLAHRGPDNQGEWFDDHTYMGHRRLSIIDLSVGANQPFIDRSGRYVFTFNGEIYNYIEIRAELEQRGHSFHTSSDTEVLLSALLEWGLGALTRVDGMFAAALHDRVTGEHTVMRDPMGQKPLYYFLTPDGVVYASELRSLLSLDVARWKIDRDAFMRYLMLGYYALDESPIVGVRKLLPGHWLRVGPTGVQLESYWNSVPGADEIDVSDQEALVRFEDLFAGSCARSMRSDVPYGVFLSGGIDSSLVAAFCRRINPDLQTITVAMSEPDYDESPKASSVNERLGIANHQTVTMTRQAVEQTLNDVLGSLDEPHADPGYVNTHFLARAARQHMTVALAGDGGDELFAGYPPFAGLGVAGWMRHSPTALLKSFGAVARLLPAGDGYLGLQFKALAFLRGFPASDAVRIPLWLSSVNTDELERLAGSYPPSFFSHGGEGGTLFAAVEDLLRPLRGASLQEQLLYYYQKVLLSEFVCMHTDRAAMQSSLEVRSPFLSLPLVEFANRLPPRFKQAGGELKILLKRVAARQNLPSAIVSQRKQGFTFPLARWLKTALRARAEELIAPDEWEDGLVAPGIVRQYFDDHMAGRRNNYRILYNLMVFRAWRRNHPTVEA
jgi:asparagine synthase (glutamine-hydrolysing)